MSSSNGFRRCDGFAGSIPQKFINANMPVCPMCGSDDPYWLLKDKMEWTAHRIMFRCSKCGCILSATNGDFTGTTKSTAFAVLTTAGAVNALTKKAQGKDVKTVYMRVEDVGDAQLSSALTGKELPIEEFQEMAAAFSLQASAPAAVPTPAAESEFKVSYGAEPAPAAPVFTEAPAAAPVVESAPAEEPEFKVSYGAEPVPAAPVFTEAPAAAPVVEPAPAPVEEPVFKVGYEQPAAAPAPEFKAEYAAPAAAAPAAPAPKPQRYVLKEKMPILSIVFMGIAIFTQLIRFIGSFTDFRGAPNVFNSFVGTGAVVMMLVGMILHRKKGQVLTAVGSLCMAFVSFIGIATSLRYANWTILIDVFMMAAFAIAGVYYLTKVPVLGMPLKMIAFLMGLLIFTIYLISMLPAIFRGYSYLPGYLIVSWLGEYFLAVALIVYIQCSRWL